MSIDAPAARPGVAVTGAGAMSALGIGLEALVNGLAAGADGIRPLQHVEEAELAGGLGGTVPGFESASARANAALCFAEAAAREALGTAARDRRIALVTGTSLGAEGIHHELGQTLRERLELTGPAIAISSACCSSTHAIGVGAELLLEDDADVVLAGGFDELSPALYAGFRALGALSSERCAPFSLPLGTTLGEGAGLLRLELVREGERAEGLGWVLGYGLAADARHATAPDPAGRGVARAIAASLEHAQVPPGAIDYVNAHGTATAYNDAAEWLGIQSVLGEPLVSSCKGSLGHAQGAAGALEVLATLACAGRGTVPPTRNHRGPRNGCPKDPVAGRMPRAFPVSQWVSTNSAFWGANAALVMRCGGQLRGRDESAEQAAPPPRIQVLGAQAVTAADLHPWPLPRVNPRAMDAASRVVTAACARVLAAHGFDLAGDQGDRVGLFVAALAPSREARDQLARSIQRRGLHRLDVDAFTRSVTTALGGGCACALGLRGPTSALTTGAGSGLVALACAGRYLATHAQPRAIVVVAVDEPEGASPRATAVLVSRLSLKSNEPAWDVGGIALTAPGHPEQAVARAVERTTGSDGEQRVDLHSNVVNEPDTERERRWPATESLMPLVSTDRRTLTLTTVGGTASAAIVLTR